MEEERWQKLEVWKHADELAFLVYKVTKDFPKEEIYGITSQVRRAALSVPTNTCPVKQLEGIVYYTYVLQSKKDSNLYVGFSKDLKLRFEQHEKGLVESTKNRRPLKLIYYEACINQMDATNHEKYLKTYNGRRFLHKRLKSYLTG